MGWTASTLLPCRSRERWLSFPPDWPVSRPLGAGDVADWQNAYTSTNGLNDLQNWELSSNVLVNDPAQDMGNEQDTQNETALLAFGNTVISAFVDSNLAVAGYGFTWSGCYDTNGNAIDCSGPTNLVRFTGWSRSADRGVTFTDMGAPPTKSN